LINQIDNVPMQLSSEAISILGNTLGRAPHRIFGIKLPDRIFHMFCLGQTGTGKSTLLLNMMQQDAQRDQGFCLIDPHGDLAKAVLANGKQSDQLYWDVSDPDSPYGYNPLTYVTAEYRPLVASGLIETLKKQWSDAWGARMEHLLRYSLLALLERRNSTLQDVMPMFLDKDFRNQVIASISDNQVRSFWTVEFPAMNYRTAVDGVAPIANKLGAFLAHPVVRKSLCEPLEPLRFRKIMDEGNVLIVNLAKGRLGADTANVLGGLIVSSIANAAYSRQNLPESERKPFFLFIDEFHSFTTSAFTDMLSELRKYALGIVATTQFSTRLDDTVREAIFGNVGTIISFRVGATDTAILAKQFGSDVPEPRDLVGLANYEFFVKLMIDGTQSKPFSAKTLPPDSSILAA
jgi:type IV secretory pathway TraG/TraD family ATPase VirD4